MISPDNLKKIPSELKARPQWVIWRSEIRDGKPTKVPYQPHNPQEKAKSTDPATWGTCEQALSVAETDGFQGIGYVFSPQDDYAGVDLDKCRNPETGIIEPWAVLKISRLASYTEISPSGAGVHILIKGKVPPGGNKKGKVEMYSHGRYFTMTGAHLEGTTATIEARQGELEALHKGVFGKPQPLTPTGAKGAPLEVSDFALIDLAKSAGNGHKFSQLWGGDTTGYDSPSEATVALCLMLAYWTGKDPGRMDRLFRQSGLMRDKFDRPQSGSTWGALQIQKAITKTTDVYTPKKAIKKAPEKPQGEVKPSVLANIKLAPGGPVPTWPDVAMGGAAGRFARTYAKYLETPESFLFMNYCTLLGHEISSRVTLDSELYPQTRLYCVNLGESSITRKSTSIFKTAEFFGEALPDQHHIYGVGSAEGLAEAIKATGGRAVLILDELNSLIQKMKIDGSILLPCLTTLFESSRYHNHTKKGKIIIDNAELCILGASTIATYQTMFGPNTINMGFINRMFVVTGRSERKFAVPVRMPDAEYQGLKDDLLKVMGHVENLTTMASIAGGRYIFPVEPAAKAIYQDWYMNREASVFTARLSTYGHRLMVIFAVNELKDRITPDIVRRVIMLLDYQLEARKHCDPIDADNAIARIEERIRRLLANGPRTKRDLEQAGNKGRVGIWIWQKALDNLGVETHPWGKTVAYKLPD